MKHLTALLLFAGMLGGCFARAPGADDVGNAVRDTVRVTYSRTDSLRFTRLTLQRFEPIEPVPGQVFQPWTFVTSYAFEDSLTGAKLDSAVMDLGRLARKVARMTETYEDQQ